MIGLEQGAQVFLDQGFEELSLFVVGFGGGVAAAPVAGAQAFAGARA